MIPPFSGFRIGIGIINFQEIRFRNRFQPGIATSLRVTTELQAQSVMFLELSDPLMSCLDGASLRGVARSADRTRTREGVRVGGD